MRFSVGLAKPVPGESVACRRASAVPGQRYTLLAAGDSWQDASDSSPFGAPDVQHWRPASVDGDGRADLVRFEALEPVVRVEYSLSRGDGTWTHGSRTYFTTDTIAGFDLIPALRAPRLGGFLTADLDGNGLSDFVLAEPGAKTRLRVLSSDGAGNWTARTDQIALATTEPDARRLTATDVNADRATDLALAGAEACPVVSTPISTGTGWQLDRPPLQPCASPPADVCDATGFRWFDVDHDGRTDLVHPSRNVSESTTL